MQLNKHALITSALMYLVSVAMAQHNNVTAGGDATGAGGSMSYSTGQVDYLFYSSPQGSLSLGLQQTWFTIPEVLEIPEAIITDGQSLCFDATGTVIVAGDGRQFTLESGAHADIIAGQNILMKEGTTVETGGSLHAYISEVFCDQPESLLASFEEQIKPEPAFEPVLKETFFKVYPNPTTGDFTLELLEFDEASVIMVEIYTLQGKLITRDELPAEWRYTFSIAEHQPGIYLIRAIKDQNIGAIKIIKQ